MENLIILAKKENNLKGRVRDMLHQNWFMNPRFEMFEDYGESQSFYDTETGIIYVVFEEYGMKGSTIIQEITPESTEYKPNYERYKAFKGMTYKVKLVMSDEYIIEAHSKEEAEKLARDKFGNDYLIDVVIITEME